MRPRCVLFLCTGNSARSQMAEGMLRRLGGDRVEVFSAGTAPSGVHPLAIQVMAERGIDISGQRSKHLEEYLGRNFDCVITLCDSAQQACPIFPGKYQRDHWPLEDPAAAQGNEEERRVAFCRVRDEIEARIRDFLASPSEND